MVDGSVIKALNAISHNRAYGISSPYKPSIADAMIPFIGGVVCPEIGAGGHGRMTPSRTCTVQVTRMGGAESIS